MAQWLKVHPASTVTLDFIPNTHIQWLSTTCNYSSRGSEVPSSDLCGNLHRYGVQICTQVPTHTCHIR